MAQPPCHGKPAGASVAKTKRKRAACVCVAMLLILAALQASAPLPDIQFSATVRARQVIVDQRGTTSLTVRAEPDGGSTVRTQAPPAQARLKNVTITLDAAARIAPNAASTALQQGD